MSTRPVFVPTLSSRFAVYVRDYLMDRGINPQVVFDESDLALPSGEDHDAPIPVAQVAQLFYTAAVETANPAMGLAMGESFHYESSSLLIVAMLAADNVREGLRFLAKYDRYIDSGITVKFAPERVPAEFYSDLIHESNQDVSQINEYLMAFLVRTLFTATRKRVPLLEVAFSHAAPVDTRPQEQFFKSKLCFGAKIA